jgi:hypothetical protein
MNKHPWIINIIPSRIQFPVNVRPKIENGKGPKVPIQKIIPTQIQSNAKNPDINLSDDSVLLYE